MWILYGTSRWHQEEKIASFSSEELAKEYIEKSKLKKPTWDNSFKRSSMLAGYMDAWVEWQDDLIHDPEPK